jgi:hypothetical protein
MAWTPGGVTSCQLFKKDGSPAAMPGGHVYCPVAVMMLPHGAIRVEIANDHWVCGSS